MSAVDSKVNSSANRVDEAWWRRKKERRGRREKKNLPKRLLPASRNSRAISMLRSLPSSPPLSLSWKEILLRKQMRPWIMERVHCLPPLLSLHLCSRLIAYLRVALLNCLVIDAKYIYIRVSVFISLYHRFPIFTYLLKKSLWKIHHPSKKILS